LTSVRFVHPSQCQAIGKYAFYECRRLSYVEIPASVITIKTGAFINCVSLIPVFYNLSLLTNVGFDVFAGTPYIATWSANVVILNTKSEGISIADD
jgi:hypothetical protein